MVYLNVLVELVGIVLEKSRKSKDKVQNVTKPIGANGKLNLQKIR